MVESKTGFVPCFVHAINTSNLTLYICFDFLMLIRQIVLGAGAIEGDEGRASFINILLEQCVLYGNACRKRTHIIK